MKKIMLLVVTLALISCNVFAGKGQASGKAYAVKVQGKAQTVKNYSVKAPSTKNYGTKTYGTKNQSVNSNSGLQVGH